MSGFGQLVGQPMDEDAVAPEVLRRIEGRDHAELERPHPRDYTRWAVGQFVRFQTSSIDTRRACSAGLWPAGTSAMPKLLPGGARRYKDAGLVVPN